MILFKNVQNVYFILLPHNNEDFRTLSFSELSTVDVSQYFF